jgi:transcriptional regulator with XRE-family HTH domain
MPEDVRRLVGGNVRRLRIAAGLTQAKLSERIGVDRAYVSGLELGERNPTVIALWHVAQALRTKMDAPFKDARPRRLK